MSGDDLEPFKPAKNHWTNVHFTERINRAELRYLLMERPKPIVNGRLVEWQYEKVGPNVYEIWLEPPEQ